MSDNLNINPSEFYFAIKDVELSIDELENVKKTINSLKDLEVDTSSYELRINNICDNLEKLHGRLLKEKNEYIKLDKSISNLFDYLDNEENDDEDNSFNNMNIGNKNDTTNKGKQLDSVKGNNKDLGGRITSDVSSIMRGRL